MPELTFVDLFSGAGGLSLGFQNAGFKCVKAVEYDEFALRTYRQHFRHEVTQEEITEHTILPTVSVVAGGPPCQGFSSAGLRTPDDRRNSLVKVFAQLVADFRPLAFVFENVEGFLTADDGKRVFELLEVVISAGYRVHLRKVNAANYGVPQHRKRVLAIGGLGWDPTFPAATHKAYGAPGNDHTHGHLPKCPTLRDALAGLPQPTAEPPGVPQGHYARPLSAVDSERIHRLLPGQTMRHLPSELWHDSYSRRANRRVADGTPTERRGGAPAGVRRLGADEPSKSITGGATAEFVHPSEDRYLTLRECARIQGFPDDFTFAGDAQACAIQIGNAVPVRLAEIVAQTILKDLRGQGTARYRQGALLTFVPTHSTGFSPVLRRVTKAITERFLTQPSIPMEQGQLWD